MLSREAAWQVAGRRADRNQYGHVTVKPAGLAGQSAAGAAGAPPPKRRRLHRPQAMLIGNKRKGRADFKLKKFEDLIRVARSLENY